MEQLKLFRNNLPKKPYCTNDPSWGLIIRSAETASKYRHIQPNNPNSKLWLLFDIDRATDPEELTDDLLLPAPTIWVQNPENKHAHALYALETPIHMNDDSSHKAIRYAAAVDVSLSQKMKADAGYAGLICNNPLNEHWRTYVIGGSYDLHDLSEYVDLRPFNDRRKNLPDIGLGRNCTLFDRLRKWAYKAIRQGWPDYERWLMAVEQRSIGYNDFSTPLDSREVQQIAKSVARWTHRNLTPGGFEAFIKDTHTPELQAIRGKKGGLKSGVTRKIKAENRALKIINLKSQGLSNKEIAIQLDIHVKSIPRILRNYQSDKGGNTKPISDSSPLLGCLL
jgi:hypothetical protein